ncbi:RNA polymerase sigma-70 factor [Algoriphagus zhangzhouensis]|uniref:RNA polymerase sigma-70 factor, ECF subfamily n=1 Tax=Algoriphagus zhangzhouensis TaxID=1073327 RepID=A0A1M7ZI54_9BACT|nr:RNA polymerase sigma-70 factor [Algoriphagus zhangzhouensis]TDY44321.1 RNA polymerase sigma-70 factor (ECF subfamily) [Algoriphagus zhangzhouensis]SHO64554.1 RNA polymerase sigma-70 factor, ECF subfamily [Algoriphagus zhangzhouensis]
MQGQKPADFSEIQKGDMQAFERVFKEHYDGLCRFANSYLLDVDEAEEVVQGTFIGFWEKRENLQIETSLKAYLYRSVRNSCLNEIKRQKVRQVHAQAVLQEEVQVAEASDHDALKMELEDRIHHAIQKLPEQCRLIFKMSRFEELKYQEIADQLGLSIKTVENQIGKALKVLREQLKDYLPMIIVLMKGFLDL